jgi:glycosyltransferase involved in cell wall biosynthesis
MKVVFVTRGWPTKDNPMSGNYEAVQAMALAKSGIEVTVVTLYKKSLLHLFDSRTVKRQEENGILVLSKPLVVFEIPGLSKTKYNRFDLWLGQRAFCKVYEFYRRIKGDADLIHAHIIHNAYHCKKVIDKYHIPFVITEHWSKMNSTVLDSGLVKLAGAYKWAGKILCVSNALAASLHRKFGINCVVVHNMVSQHFFDCDINVQSRNDGIIQFVSVGSLVEGKRFDILIRAFSKAKHLDSSQLRIIGSGPEMNNLKRLIEKLELQEKVSLLGRKKPEEVSALMAESDCFALTSLSETFGIVYIEAMAKGKPVIATICGGPESFVNESNGILIPTEDVEATTKAIDYMVENVDKYDNAAIRQYCHDNFSEEAISQKIITVYKEVLEKHKK